MKTKTKCVIAGASAGIINGFFGTGGGMVCVPLLCRWAGLENRIALATTVMTIAPLCVLSAIIYWLRNGIELSAALPYLVGGMLGGIVAGIVYGKISALWLRRAFGALLLLGGVRMLLQ